MMNTSTNKEIKMTQTTVTENSVVLSFDLNGVSGITIKKVDAVFALTWTDYVVNEWTENYPTLSVALARAAALVSCGEAGWEKGFAHAPETFSANAEKFLSVEAI
jgi:hypothetical protein